MADEIKVTIQATVVNGNFRERFDPGQQTIDQSGTVSMGGGSISVTTTATTLYLGGVTNPGVSWFTNLDSTSLIQLGPASTGGMNPCVQFNSGESWIFRLTTGSTFFVKATTSPAQMRYTILGN